MWCCSGRKIISSKADASPWRLEWDEKLSVGIPEIDADHQRFICLINELNEAITAHMDMTEIIRRMQSILDDAEAHFAYEESLFSKWSYPVAQEHAQKHAQIMLALRGIIGKLEGGGLEYEWIEAGLKVKQALIEHLLAEDMKYRDYCRKNHLSSC